MTEEPYEYAVMVTNLEEEAPVCIGLYEKRGGMENNYDELMNHWGWGGFMTKDIFRCQVAARMNAIFYNWWSLFVRSTDPRTPRESITSRPLLLHAVGKTTTSGRQTTLKLTSSHANWREAQSLLVKLSMFLSGIVNTAEQLTSGERWQRICDPIIAAFTGTPKPAPLLSG